jgi:hypothetical protein
VQPADGTGAIGDPADGRGPIGDPGALAPVPAPPMVVAGALVDDGEAGARAVLLLAAWAIVVDA